jgi:galactonate dehydratase
MDEARKLIADGWPAVRFSPADPRSSVASSQSFDARASIAETAEAFTVVQEKLDKRIPLGIDYHHRLSVAEAASFCQMIPRGSLAFLEEPIRCETPDAYAALRAMTDVPFAIGEELPSKWAFLPYIERGLTNFVRVDVSCVGGLTEAKKVAGWAEAHYIDLVPHNPIGPVCTAATVHLAAACNNFAWTEINPEYNEGRSDLFPVQVEREGPFYKLPTRPGLGVDMDERMVGRYAFKIHEHPHLERPDGSYTNW